MSESQYAAATVAFRETLEHLDLPSGSLESKERQSELGRRGALLATAGLQWRDHLGPLLTWQEAAVLMASVNTRQGVNDLAQRGRLLALRSNSGALLYPLFQFRDDKPFPVLPDLLAVFRDAEVDPWTVASWFVTGQDALDDETPAAWLKQRRDQDRVLTLARRVAGRLAR